MKNEIRHEMNEGAAAERKAIRGIISKLLQDGTIGWVGAEALRHAIKVHVKATSKRKGGLGRK